MIWYQYLSTSLQLSHLRQMSSTIIILKKQILRWRIWFKCCHCKQLLSQKSDWLQTILCHSEKLLKASIKKLHFLMFSSEKLCLLIVSLKSLHFLIVSTLERRSLVFSIWSKTLKNSICCANRYLINFMKNQKKISHLFWSEIKFWKKWTVFLCLNKKQFKIDS